MTDAERLAKAYNDERERDQPPDMIAAFQRLIDSGVVTVNPPPDPERSDAEVLADLVALSDAGQVQIHMTHVDEGLPVYEVSWRKPGWSPPPHGPDIAAAGRSLGWPVARVLEMAQPYINPPPDPAVVVTKEIAARVWPDMGWGPVDLYPVHADLVAAVRDLFTTDALEAAAAKVQEAET